jgi:hypothetical protein
MKMPGFTAEASLYKMNARYQEAVKYRIGNTAAVRPASTQNVTLSAGSVIDHRCYSECVHECIHERGGPKPGLCIRLCRSVCRVD